MVFEGMPMFNIHSALCVFFMGGRSRMASRFIGVLIFVRGRSAMSSFCFYFFGGNYTKPTCGLGENQFAYPWFEKYQLTHLWYVPFVFRNPSLIKSGVNRYFCSNFMSLSSQNKK